MWEYVNHHGVYGVNESNACFYIRLVLLRSKHVWSEWQYPSTPTWYHFLLYIISDYTSCFDFVYAWYRADIITWRRPTVHIQNEHNKHPTLETQWKEWIVSARCVGLASQYNTHPCWSITMRGTFINIHRKWAFPFFYLYFCLYLYFYLYICVGVSTTHDAGHITACMEESE